MIGKGFPIGRLFGISIRMDWSWLFILLLITWNLTFVFNRVRPEWNAGLSWGMALLAALLFFSSVLAHELAHSLVAKSQGLPVHNITLFLFGGVANIQREPDSPKNEFLIAIAGPVTSLVLGFALLLLGTGGLITAGQIGLPVTGVGDLSPLNTMLLWLGSVNIFLAIFNLIPGLPLDGGRVLRSILWAITNNLRTATRIASFVGQAIAWIMIVAGIVMAFGVRIPFLGTGFINGIWLVFIGWFLNNAAMQSYQQVEIKDILEGVTVSRLMRQDPPTVEPDCKISDLVHTHLMGTDDQAFPVLEQERLVGIVTLDDIRRVPRAEWDTVRVQEIMTPSQNLVTSFPNEDASKALEKLIQRDVRQLPVVRPDGFNNAPELLGLLRRRDIMRWMQIHPDRAGNSRGPG